MRTGMINRLLFNVGAVIVLLLSFNAGAQNPQAQALQLVKQAMTAYGNLDLDTATRDLDQAIALSAYLSAGQVARIYISYGLVYAGGLGDNARAQQSFTIARCLDPAVQIDPLYSTPDVDMVFRMAQAKATAQNCPAMLQGVRYSATPMTPQPMAPQPMPVAPQPTPLAAQPVAPPAPVMGPAGVPNCGVHTAPTEQREATELALAVRVDPSIGPRIANMKIKYAFDGATTFFELPMSIKDGWASGMITCVEGQITDFNPSSISYFIEGYDNTGGLVCGQGAATQPFTVIMSPSAPVVSGLPGQPSPQTCKECPPWDQECQARSGQPIACFADDECPGGAKCADTGFCEGGDLDSGFGDEGDSDFQAGDSPKRVYFNATIGTGGGFASAPNVSAPQVWWDGNGSSPSQIYTWDNGAGVKSGGWGGLPVRALLGINIVPDFALEVGFRFDLQSLFTKQIVLGNCDGYAAGAVDSNYTCYAGGNQADPGVGSVWGWQEGGAYHFYTTQKSETGKAWLANIRGRFRFVNDGQLQVSFFGGVGYGHLFFAPKIKDIDLGGNDPVIATPGMVNIELGPGFAYYFNPHVGFVIDVPIDLVFGEDGSFGMNGEIALGLSFGG